MKAAPPKGRVGWMAKNEESAEAAVKINSQTSGTRSACLGRDGEEEIHQLGWSSCEGCSVEDFTGVRRVGIKPFPCLARRLASL